MLLNLQCMYSKHCLLCITYYLICNTNAGYIVSYAIYLTYLAILMRHVLLALQLQYVLLNWLNMYSIYCPLCNTYYFICNANAASIVSFAIYCTYLAMHIMQWHISSALQYMLLNVPRAFSIQYSQLWNTKWQMCSAHAALIVSFVILYLQSSELRSSCYYICYRCSAQGAWCLYWIVASLHQGWISTVLCAVAYMRAGVSMLTFHPMNLTLYISSWTSIKIR